MLLYRGFAPAAAAQPTPLALSGLFFAGGPGSEVDGSLRDCIPPPPLGARMTFFTDDLTT
ncbi:MAG: hypothetical protein EA402_12390 [Planctomycetota bacterium]|nr:MAG: hypothetical protein EA402_12390 [Planctomycetota bacterium]